MNRWKFPVSILDIILMIAAALIVRASMASEPAPAQTREPIEVRACQERLGSLPSRLGE